PLCLASRPSLPTPQLGLMRDAINCCLTIQSMLYSNRELDLNFPCDSARHLGLQRQNVMQAALVALRPQMGRIADADQLRSDAHPLSRATHAAFQEVRHTQLLPDLLSGLGGGLVQIGR